MVSTTTATTPAYEVVWEKLPDEFALPNDPGERQRVERLAAQLRAAGIEPEL